MVVPAGLTPGQGSLFQYSLCRVVLMVKVKELLIEKEKALSVLALSSRFDGPAGVAMVWIDDQLSVLALSSRFDGHRTRQHP